MRRISRSLARRIALPAVAAALAGAGGIIPAAASTAGPIPECVNGTNATTGQTIQVCAIFTGVFATSNSETVAVLCYAVSGPASVQTAIGCSMQGNVSGILYQAPIVNLPGDVAATQTQATDVNQGYTVCIAGHATDINNNLVEVPPTCLP